MNLAHWPRLDVVEKLWAIEEIKQLKARYCRAFDTRDWDAFADCFTEDCRHSWDSDFSESFKDKASYLEHVKTQLVPGISVHHCVLPEITIVGPCDATGTWAMADYIDAAEESKRPGKFRGYGYYDETYRREADGKWRISAKRIRRLRVDTL
jgi:uncharacterized protein (TIGR02246 family)